MNCMLFYHTRLSFHQFCGKPSIDALHQIHIASGLMRKFYTNGDDFENLLSELE